jgi:hypothetical protein
LDDDGQPTNQILPKRRESKLLTPVPKPQKRRRKANQPGFVFDSGHGLSTEEQEYNPTPIINEIRRYVEDWRNLPNPIENVADDADLEEVYDSERHLLYVACTRARDHLLVTGVKPPSEFLGDLLN